MTAPEVPDWTRVVLLSGIDPSGNPITIAVDTHGYIIAVMTGEYAGVPKNIAVDASGRVIMIPTDPADIWGNAISMGNAELAAVFSPTKRYDRRGNVLFTDSFETGLSSLTRLFDHADSTVTLTSTYSLFGGLCAKLTARAAASSYAGVEAVLGIQAAAKMGLECSFRIDTSALYAQLMAYISWNLTRYQFFVRYNIANTQWEYWDGDGNWSAATAAQAGWLAEGQWNTVKVVVDPSTGKYVRLLCNGQNIDMSAKSCKTNAVAARGIIAASFTNFGIAATARTMYLDNLTITTNEPA